MLRRIICILAIGLILTMSAMGAVTIKPKIYPAVSPNNGSLYITDDLIDNTFNIYNYSFRGIIENLNLSENDLDTSKFSLELWVVYVT